MVLKVEGNLTINENVILTSVKSRSGYGGPKGMVVYCTGRLTNNGTISMTRRGAKAVGENVFLWKNANNTYEYVPATGGAGGARGEGSEGGVLYRGKEGGNGVGRATGGGSGGAMLGAYAGPSAGATGTSYSRGWTGEVVVLHTVQLQMRKLMEEEGQHLVVQQLHVMMIIMLLVLEIRVELLGDTHGEHEADGTGGLLVIRANEFKNSRKH